MQQHSFQYSLTPNTMNAIMGSSLKYLSNVNYTSFWIWQLEGF